MGEVSGNPARTQHLIMFYAICLCLLLYIVRKWRVKRNIGGEGTWEWEVGEEATYAKRLQSSAAELLVESSSEVSWSFTCMQQLLAYPADQCKPAQGTARVEVQLRK